MVWTLHTLAIIISGIFAGGAMMQTVVDHPARLAGQSRCSIEQMKRSLQRADPYMPGLAASAAVTGYGAYLAGASIVHLVAAMLFVAIGIYTFAFIIPINKKVQSAGLNESDVLATIGLMRRWGTLHAARSVTGTVALVLFATASPWALR